MGGGFRAQLPRTASGAGSLFFKFDQSGSVELFLPGAGRAEGSVPSMPVLRHGVDLPTMRRADTDTARTRHIRRSPVNKCASAQTLRFSNPILP